MDGPRSIMVGFLLVLVASAALQFLGPPREIGVDVPSPIDMAAVSVWTVATCQRRRRLKMG